VPADRKAEFYLEGCYRPQDQQKQNFRAEMKRIKNRNLWSAKQRDLQSGTDEVAEIHSEPR